MRQRKTFCEDIVHSSVSAENIDKTDD